MKTRSFAFAIIIAAIVSVATSGCMVREGYGHPYHHYYHRY